MKNMDSIDVIIEIVKRLTGKKRKPSTVTVNKILVKKIKKKKRKKKSSHLGASEFEDPSTIKADRFI